MPSSFEKSGRDLERDLLRRSRGYTQKIQSTTSGIVRKPIASGTQNHYENMLREWDSFIDEYEGVPDPTNVKTAKDFMLYFSTGRKGRNEADGPLTVSYTYAAWKWFMAAWSRKHHISFVKSHQDTLKNFIEGGEASSAPTLSRKTRPRRNFTLQDFDLCVKQLWQNDWHDYIHERYRVGLQLLLLLHCNTSGRRGEYERELRYADITIALVWLKDKDQPQIIIDFRRTKAKGLQSFEREQPQHMLYELVDLPFYFNSVAFFMAAVLADGGLRDYRTWDDICAIPKPTQQKHIILEYDPEKLQWPVFPRSSRTGCIDHTRPSTSLTSNALLDLGFRTGFRENLTLHAARREALLKVDNFGYSCDQRMRFAGHTNPHTYRRSYQPSMSMVDGQATFFDYEPENNELHQLYRGYSWGRNPCHQPYLPEATRTRLQEKMQGEADSDGQELPQDPKERQKGYDHWRQHQERLLRAQYAAPPMPKGRPYESSFSQARKLMPQRDRLATNLFKIGNLRGPVGRQIMEDLVQLCQSESPVTFCSGLNSSPSECAKCRKTKEKSQEHVWWSHLYHCHKKDACSRGGFAEFCFMCFAWYHDRDSWQKHVAAHLQSLPLQCNMEVFRHNVIRPALCPACLGDQDVAPEDRFRQYVNLATWKGHVRQHACRKGVKRCRHPRCLDGGEYETETEYLLHLADVHEICFPHRENCHLSKYPTSDVTVKQFTFVDMNHNVCMESSETMVQGSASLGANQGCDDSLHNHQLNTHPVTDGSGHVPSRELLYRLNGASDTNDVDMVDVIDPVDMDGMIEESSINCIAPSDACFHQPGFDARDSPAMDRSVDKTTETLLLQEEVPMPKQVQGRRSRQPKLVINVPPVPEEWKRQRSKLDSQKTFPLPPASACTDGDSNGSRKLGRGRPAGSQNKKTLMKARRHAIMKQRHRARHAESSIASQK